MVPSLHHQRSLKGVVYIACWVGVLVAGCHIGQDYVPDAMATTDGPVAGSPGLNVSWSTKPTIPGDLGNGIRVDSAIFKLDTFRVIGDAGDTHTTKSGFDLAWSGGVKPDKIAFADAPTGLYSRVSIQADGHIVAYSYVINGSVKVGSNTYDLRVNDRNAVNVSVIIDQMLLPGKSETIQLELQLQPALNAVDWSVINHDDGKVELDTTDPQMPAFRAALIQGFVVVSSGQPGGGPAPP